MRKRLLVILLPVAIVSLVLGAAQAWAWQKDPDLVDPARVITSTLLPPPDATVGDADTSIAGTADTVVGLDPTVSDPPDDPPPSGNTFIVDNTPLDGDCPNANYTSIQLAVNDSGPNDTVKVCPGTYQEQVRIMGHSHDGLKLESLKPLQAIIKWPTTESAPLALVDFNSADHVTLRDFTVTGPFTFPACSPERHEGLLVENAFNERILHNHITMIQNSNPALYGCQEGDAVAIGHRFTSEAGNPCAGTIPGSALVAQNSIDEYQKNGVQVFNTGSFANVDHNVITASSNVAIRTIIASNGVVVFCNAGATVEHNAVSNNQYAPGGVSTPLSTGIIVDEAPAGSSEVDHNSVFNNDFGIETDTQMGLEISHNSVFNNLADAITLCGDTLQGCGPATQIVVRKNDVENNGGSGILLLGADSNLLKSNQVQGNGTAAFDTTDGIRVDTSSTNNQILENHMARNVTHDCHDDSTGAGSGTPPTANTWTNDQGDTQNRDGLCRGATTT